MARLYLFAEGQTEQTFADNLLKPHLANYEVYLHRPVLVTSSRRRGTAQRGGGRHYLPMKNDVCRFLRQEKAPDVFFTTMIDLYALYSDFPSFADADSLKHDPYERVRFLEERFAEDIDDRRFIPHLQLHEYEAYLFCDLRSLSLFYEDENKLASLESVANEIGNPELINDSPETAPSKRIIAQFPHYAVAKTTVGVEAAELIGLATIRAQCSHFNTWISRLEALGAV